MEAGVVGRGVRGGGRGWGRRRGAATPPLVALAAALLTAVAAGCTGPGAGEAAGDPADRSASYSDDASVHAHRTGPGSEAQQSHGSGQDHAHDSPAGGGHDHDHHSHDGAGDAGAEAAAEASGHGHHGAAHLARGARMTIVPAESGRALLLSVGPVRLPAAEGEAVMRITPGLEAPIGFDGWLVGMDVRVEDAHGAVLPNDLLHHINLILPGRRDLFRPMMQRLGAAGPETDAMRLPWPLGFRVGGDEELLVVAVLHNESARDYGDVYVRAVVETRRRGRVAAYPFMMDVIPPPLPAAWDLPPGRSERSWEGSPAVDGRILGIGAHMHRYGQELVLEDVTAGRVLHRSQPVLDDDGEIISIPQEPLLPFGVRLRADHRYRVTAVYHNPTADTIPDGAMGVFGGVFRPSGDWPDVEPTEPLYQDDRAAIRR